MKDAAAISAAWAQIKGLPVPDLRDLFAAEPDRLSAQVLSEGGLRFDFSKTHLSDETLAAFLSRQFRGNPVVGDRLRAHGVELVVRAVERGIITRVGLKLHD